MLREPNIFRQEIEQHYARAQDLLVKVRSCVQNLDRINEESLERNRLQDEYSANIRTLTDAQDDRVKRQIEIRGRRIEGLMKAFPSVKQEMEKFIGELIHLFERIPIDAENLNLLAERTRKIALMQRRGSVLADLNWRADCRDLEAIVTRLEEAIELARTHETNLMKKEIAQNRRALLEHLAAWQQQNQNQFANVDDLAQSFGIDADRAMQQFEILECQSRVQLLKSQTGANVRMTPKGWYSLERPENELNIPAQSTNFNVVDSSAVNITNIHHSPGATVIQGGTSDRVYEELVISLDRLADMIARDDGIKGESKQDLVDNVDRIKTEMKRAKPDSESIWRWFDRLSKIGGTTKLVETVAPYLSTASDLLRKLLSEHL